MLYNPGGDRGAGAGAGAWENMIDGVDYQVGCTYVAHLSASWTVIYYTRALGRLPARSFVRDD